jgi:septum formation protein
VLLASGSPRRIELLRALGVDFEPVAPDLDENAFPEPALAKAEAVARPGEVTLGADTLVYLGEERLGKPTDLAHAREMLHRLAGRDHIVRTVVALIGASGRRLRFAVRSRVWTKPADGDRIEAFLATGEPLGKAGAYNIQGAGGALIASYEGCYSNIVGLPLCHTYYALRRAGVVSERLPEDAFKELYGRICPAARCAEMQGRSLRDGAEYDSWRAG